MNGCRGMTGQPGPQRKVEALAADATVPRPGNSRACRIMQGQLLLSVTVGAPPARVNGLKTCRRHLDPIARRIGGDFGWQGGWRRLTIGAPPGSGHPSSGRAGANQEECPCQTPPVSL